jgi:ankyrin repeat protein
MAASLRCSELAENVDDFYQHRRQTSFTVADLIKDLHRNEDTHRLCHRIRSLREEGGSHSSDTGGSWNINTLLFCALRLGRVDVCDTILEQGATLTDHTVVRPLHKAVRHGDIVTVDWICRKYAIGARRIIDRDALLMRASTMWQPQVVFCLLRHGCDINSRDGAYKRTALHAACAGPATPCHTRRLAADGQSGTAALATVSVLLAAGADANACDIYGLTPLHVVALRRLCCPLRAVRAHDAPASTSASAFRRRRGCAVSAEDIDIAIAQVLILGGADPALCAPPRALAALCCDLHFHRLGGARDRLSGTAYEFATAMGKRRLAALLYDRNAKRPSSL